MRYIVNFPASATGPVQFSYYADSDEEVKASLEALRVALNEKTYTINKEQSTPIDI